MALKQIEIEFHFTGDYVGQTEVLTGYLLADDVVLYYEDLMVGFHLVHEWRGEMAVVYKEKAQLFGFDLNTVNSKRTHELMESLTFGMTLADFVRKGIEVTEKRIKNEEGF